MPSPGFLLASYFGSLNSENRGSFPLSEVMTINPEIRPPDCTKQTHFKPINGRILAWKPHKSRIFKSCFSISHLCNSTQIPVIQTASPGHYQAPIRTVNLRSASQITASNPGLSQHSMYLKSGHIPTPDYQIRPILALFMGLQAPVRSKTPGVFAITGSPAERQTMLKSR